VTLDVRIAAFRGKRPQITGEVLAPSTMPITDVPLRVQDAIAFAHGFTPDADQTNVIVSRGGETLSLDLVALYEGGDVSQNWLLKDGDVLNVGDRNRNRVFVMGEVRVQQVKKRMTLAEALLGDSGGLDPTGGQPRQDLRHPRRPQRPRDLPPRRELARRAPSGDGLRAQAARRCLRLRQPALPLQPRDVADPAHRASAV
jgi:hypothetical protein